MDEEAYFDERYASKTRTRLSQIQLALGKGTKQTIVMGRVRGVGGRVKRVVKRNHIANKQNYHQERR